MKKINIFIACFLVIILVCVGVYIFVQLVPIKQGMDNVADNILFYRQYPKASQENVFKFTTISDSIKLLKEGTGIIYYGFPSCKWCQAYVEILNEVAREQEVDTIWYYDIKEDRATNSEQYQELVKIIQQYLSKDSEENFKVFVPDVYFVKDGKVVGHNNDTSMISGMEIEDYYSEEVRSALKENLRECVKMVYPSTCNDESGEC